MQFILLLMSLQPKCSNYQISLKPRSYLDRLLARHLMLQINI